MLFGLSDDQRKKLQETPKLTYLWFPRTLDDGRLAWLEWVMRYWYEDEGANWAGDSSGYRYRAIMPIVPSAENWAMTRPPGCTCRTFQEAKGCYENCADLPPEN